MERDDFSNRMWFTYKARYNAHARLLLQNAFYSCITASLSVFIVIINILQIVPDLLNINQSATICYTISLSIIILVISIIFGSIDKKGKAEKFHSCALEVQKIYTEYTSRKNILSDEEIQKYTIKYSDILLKYDINHSTTDYNKVKISREGTGFKDVIIYYIQSFFINYFLLFILLLVPIYIGILIIFWK
jgi:hypothetical protein